MALASGTISTANESIETFPTFTADSCVQLEISGTGPQIVHITAGPGSGSSWAGALGVYWSATGTVPPAPTTLSAANIFNVGTGFTETIPGSSNVQQYSVEVPPGFIYVSATSLTEGDSVLVGIASMDLQTGSGVINTVTGEGPFPDWNPGSFVSLPTFGTGPQVAIITVYENTWTEPLSVYWSPDGTSGNLQTIDDSFVIRTDTGATGGIASGAAQYSVQIGATVPSQGTAPGAIYVAAGSGSGSAFLSIELQDCDMLLDVTKFGAVGNGLVDDTAAIQAAIDFGVACGSNRRTIVKFPAGTFLISSTLVIPEGAQNVRLQGCPTSPTNSPTVPASILIWNGNTTDSLLQAQNASGFSCDGLGFTYQISEYTGNLIDVSAPDPATVSSDGVQFLNCIFSPFGGSGEADLNTAKCYVLISGVTNGVFSGCWFAGSQRAVINDAGSLGVTNNITFCNGCHFVGSALPPILNPDESWSFIAYTIEPMSVTVGGTVYKVAGFIEVQTGFAGNGLVISGCWIGDDTAALSTQYAWIIWAGLGLVITGNTIYCNKYTTALRLLSGSNCLGICIQGNYFNGSGGNSTAVDTSLATTWSDFAFLANGLSSITTQLLSVVQPPRSLYSSVGDLINGTSAQFAGQVTAASFLAGAVVGANLMPYNDATFTDWGSALYYPAYDWYPDNGCTLAAGTGSYAGTMAMISSGGNMSALFPSPDAASTLAVPVLPGQTVTFLAKFLSAPPAMKRTVYIAWYSWEAGVFTYRGEGSQVVTDDTLTQCSLTIQIPATGVTRVAMELIVLDAGEDHYISDVSISAGTPSLVWSAPTSETVPPTPTPLLQLNGAGANVGVGGTSGFAVGNGAGSSLGGPLVAGSLTRSAVSTAATSYDPAYTDWLVYCTGSGTNTVNLPTVGDLGIEPGIEFVIVNGYSGSTVNVEGTFVNVTNPIVLTTLGQMVKVVLVQTGLSTYGWLVTSAYTP